VCSSGAALDAAFDTSTVAADDDVPPAVGASRGPSVLPVGETVDATASPSAALLDTCSNALDSTPELATVQGYGRRYPRDVHFEYLLTIASELVAESRSTVASSAPMKCSMT